MEKAMATHSSVFAWRIPGTGLLSLGLHRVGHDWSDLAVAVAYPFDGEGNGTPLQHSCLENLMDGGAWWAAVHGVAKSWTRLSDFTFTFHFHALEKEMATHSSVLAWRIPGTGEPHGLPSMGSHRVGHDWGSSSNTFPPPLDPPKEGLCTSSLFRQTENSPSKYSYGSLSLFIWVSQVTSQKCLPWLFYLASSSDCTCFNFPS